MKTLQLDLTPYNINGIIHVGAGTGEYAKYYHDLGVYKVLWVEKEDYLYSPLYEATNRYGMKQDIVIAELSNRDERNEQRFLSVWREKAAYMDVETYDCLHLECKQNHTKVLEGFGHLLESVKIIVMSNCPDEKSAGVEDMLKSRGYFLTSYTDKEKLFVRE